MKGHLKKIFLWFLGTMILSSNLIGAEKSMLSEKQKSIIPIGDLENLRKSLNEGLDSKLTINEIKEILIQSYAYTGFPRSLNGINTFMEVLKEREKNGIKDELGKEPSPIEKTLIKI